MIWLKKPFWIASLSVLVIFWIGAFTTEAKQLAEFIGLLQMSFAVAVVISYSRDAWQSAKKSNPASDDLLLLGIVCAWTGTFAVGAWLVAWRLSGQPSWMVNSDFLNSLRVLQTYGALLHLAAPGAIGGVVPRKNMIRIGVMTGAACLAAVIMLTFSSNVGMIVRMLRPLVEQPNNAYESPVIFRP